MVGSIFNDNQQFLEKKMPTYDDAVFSCYKRLIETAKAEQILDKCNVHVDINSLRYHIIQNKQDTESYKYLKLATEGDGFISSKYYGRDKRTFRIFAKKGELNLINLSHKPILDALTSRYENGRIVMIDYSTHEFTILKYLLKLQLPEDTHTWAAKLLEIERSEAKILNSSCMYGKDDIVWNTLNILHSTTKNIDSLREYTNFILETREEIQNYVKPKIEEFKESSYVINQYGRKIYPNSEDNIFNNITQSIGSEILIDCVIKINEFIQKKRINMLFQRFDSIYFDFDKENLYNHLEDIYNIMCSINPDIELKAKISVGTSVGTLKELK